MFRSKKKRKAVFLKAKAEVEDWDFDTLRSNLDLRTAQQVKERVLFNILRNAYTKLDLSEDEFEVLYYQEAMFKIAELHENEHFDQKTTSKDG